MSSTTCSKTLAFTCVAALMGCSAMDPNKPMMRGDSTVTKPAMSAESAIANWPKTPKEVAMKTIGKYGAPNEVTPTMLVWHNNGPWKKTVVFMDEVKHDFPGPHTDLMQQWIAYKVPLDKYSDMAKYDGSVVIERTTGMMSARCDKEEANFLAINLANDVATGKRTVDDARKFYAEAVKQLMQGGKPPYTQGLQFQAAASGTADPDKPAQ